jgi:AcrR family transcriptional regulator
MARSPKSPRPHRFTGPAAAPAASPRFQRRPEARPEELLSAAVSVFGERGFRATTLEEVAQRAGVSKGTVYLYFASKDDLFRAMVEKKVIAQLEDVEALARRHTGSAAELLTETVQRIWDALARKDMVCLMRTVQAELPNFPGVKRFFFEHVIQRHRRLLRGIIERGVASGEFRPQALRVVPLMLPALMVQLHQSRFLFGDVDKGCVRLDALRDQMIDCLLNGILIRPRDRHGRDPAGRARNRTRTATAHGGRGPGRKRRVG